MGKNVIGVTLTVDTRVLQENLLKLRMVLLAEIIKEVRAEVEALQEELLRMEKEYND